MEMRTPALPIVHQLHHFLRTQRLEQYDIGSTEDRQCGTVAAFTNSRIKNWITAKRATNLSRINVNYCKLKYAMRPRLAVGVSK